MLYTVEFRFQVTVDGETTPYTIEMQGAPDAQTARSWEPTARERVIARHEENGDEATARLVMTVIRPSGGI